MESLADNLDALREMGPEGVARFAESLDPKWIEEALAATGKASIRRRKLPAEQAVWLVLGMGIFEDRSIRDIVDHLNLVVDGVESLAPSAVSQARYRLGADPIEWLFRRVAEAWTKTADGLAGWRGLRLLGVDGTCMKVQDSDENFEFFGKPGGRGGPSDSGYPQLRMTCLLDLDSRLMLDASFGPYACSEHTLAESLWQQVPPGSVTILDRGFVDFATLWGLWIRGEDRHLLVRMRDNVKPTVSEILEDGTELAVLKPNRSLKTTHPYLEPWLVRVVHYHHPGGKPGRLMTTLLDPEEYPAAELIELYHRRWETEVAFDEIKTHMLERKESLRSKRVDGVYQELWGLLLVYNLVRREMLLAAQVHGVAPSRLSFQSSLHWIRSFWLTAWRSTPGSLPKHLGHFRSTLNLLILPKRRSKRRYPRHVKIKMSGYARNRGKRQLNSLN